MAKKKKDEELPEIDIEALKAEVGDVSDDADETLAEDVDGAIDDKGNKKSKKEIKRAKAQKEWEDSLTSNKRIKREENRHKLKVAMISLLVIALIVSSTVYVMLMFVETNSIKITATSSQDYKLSLSLNGESWAPIISAKGPENMWNVSYNRDYDDDATGFDVVPSLNDAIQSVTAKNPVYGTYPSKEFINTMFTLQNAPGKGNVQIQVEMKMTTNTVGLDECIRVMWVQGFSKTGTEIDGIEVLGKPEFENNRLFNDDYSKTKQVKGNKVEYNIYAARSTTINHRNRLKNISINEGVDPNLGYIEMAAYPIGTGNGDEDESLDTRWYYLDKYEVSNSITMCEKINKGFFPTKPFVNKKTIFSNYITLKDGEQLNVAMVIWIEGSDLDCINDKLNGELSLEINFKAL